MSLVATMGLPILLLLAVAPLVPSTSGHRLALVEKKRSGYPPVVSDYAWWKPAYGELAPVEVVDTCGGTPGMTKWTDISEECAKWSVKMLQCAQVCNGSNRLEGFGSCLKDKCGMEAPDHDMLCTDNRVEDENIENYCRKTIVAFRKCDCVGNPEHQSSDEWMECISTCVYDCKAALQLETDLGFDVSWKARKCPFDEVGAWGEPEEDVQEAAAEEGATGAVGSGAVGSAVPVTLGADAPGDDFADDVDADALEDDDADNAAGDGAEEEDQDDAAADADSDSVGVAEDQETEDALREGA